MLQPSVLRVTHVVGWQVVNGDVVLTQMLSAVLIKNIVARMEKLAHHQAHAKVLVLLNKSERNLQFRLVHA